MTSYAVVIPARDGRAYVADAVASVRQQTVVADEIIVVDDGSTDGTAEVARVAGARVLVHERPRGVSAARNTGIAAATAPIVAFLDADDLWTPDHAARCLAPFDLGHPCVVFGRSVTIMTDDEVVWPRIPGGTLADAIGTLLVDNTVPQSAAFVAREALRAVGGYDESLTLSEDYDLWCRLAEYGPFVHTGSTTTRRRVHPGQTTWARIGEMRVAAWEVRRRAMERLPAVERPARHSALVDALRRDRDSVMRLGDFRAFDELRGVAQRMDEALGTGDLLGGTLGGRGILGGGALFVRLGVSRLLRRVR